VLVFVDSDVLVHADAFRRIRESWAADPGPGAGLGSFDHAPAPGGAGGILRHRATTFWAGLGAVRRDAFLEVGGFDARRFPVPSVEDIELGLRLARRGELELDPRIQGKHLKRWRLGEMVFTDLVRRGAPWVALMLARGRSSIRLNVSGRHLAGTIACLGALLFAALGRPVAALLLAVAFVAVNARLYGLLLRRGGPLTAAAGFCLHVVHSVVALVAAPAGLLLFARGLLRPAPRPAALRAQPEPEGEVPPA
jgi:hypothetical protein